MTTTIAIIGSAGRRTDAARVNRKLYSAMVKAVADQILIKWKFTPDGAYLQSGGAAFADHVMVSLILECGFKGTIWGPCGWDHERQRWNDNGDRDWRTNPGGTANYYHRNFSMALGSHATHSLESIGRLYQAACADPEAGLLRIRSGVTQGYKERNKLVAKADRMIALTFGEGKTPKDGGTSHTWGLSQSNYKVHIPLSTLE